MTVPTYHTCNNCEEEAVPERCVNYKFDWELAEDSIDHDVTTARLIQRMEIGLEDYLNLINMRRKYR